MFRRPARIFAPLSLVACAVAVLVIVNTNNKESGDSNGSNPPTQTSTVTNQQPTKKTPKRYTVKPGDVLSAIAIKTGVPLDTLIRLNPNVDAQSLHAGQKLKLAP
jgi:LysM repeat protein